MNIELEKLIESIVKNLKSKNPDINLNQDFFDMVDVISMLDVEEAMEAVNCFISLMQSPKVFVTPSQDSRYPKTARRLKIG
jgi:hypothetical protein